MSQLAKVLEPQARNAEIDFQAQAPSFAHSCSDARFTCIKSEFQLNEAGKKVAESLASMFEFINLSRTGNSIK